MPTETKLRIAIACGGTGGHLFPGLAVAELLRSRGHDVTLWLSGRDTEATVVDRWKGPVVITHASGLAGLSWRSAKSALTLFRAFNEARHNMLASPPDVLLGMGSYAIVGPALAARACHIPLVLHEANAIPGSAISFLSRVATCVALTFPDSATYFNGRRTVVTGLPIRNLQPCPLPENGLPLTGTPILVMGGSQGAHAINDMASEAICALRKFGLPVEVIHLTGRDDTALVRARYEAAGVPALCLPFLKEMGAAYAVAKLAISRSGASSCMELAAHRIPALLIPLPSARRNHQTLNAKSMASTGSALCLDQVNLTPDSLHKHIRSLLVNREALDRMRASFNNSFTENATASLADLLVSVATRHRE